MTRIDNARAMAGSARDGVRHAAEVVAPYAESARDTAAQYARETGARWGPKMSSAARQARHSARKGYGSHVAPQVAKARGALPPELDDAATRAARSTRKAARQASDYARPRVEQAWTGARAAAGPARDEAVLRGGAAVAALRGGVTAGDIARLSRRRQRRRSAGMAARRLAMLGLAAGCAYAAWRWWERQANPDWLIEPPAATELGDDLTELDPEVEAKQAESDGEAKGHKR